MKIPGYDAGLKELGKARTREVKSGPKAAGKKANAYSSVSQSSEASTVSVSSKARDIHKSNEVAKSSPDVRMELVDRIAKEIKSGTYHVDSKDIAGKMLKDVLSE